MATSIYINTDLKDLTANAVANINRPTQVVRLPQIIEGEVADVVLHLVNSNGQYDARSGTAVDVAVAISAKGKAATSGTFKLNAGIESTGNLSWNASAEAVAGALNALNGGSGAYGSKVSVSKLANGSYRVIFDDVGARVDMAGQSLDLAPESEVTVGTSVVGSPTIRAQQVIEISQQPAIYSEEWASVGSTWTGQLDANTARVQELIAEGADAFFEIKVGTDVVCQVPISVFPAVAAPNSLPAHSLPNNLDAFAADPSTNGSFNPANWREDLSLVVGEDVQAWSTNLDEVAAKMEWNNQELTFDIITGSGGVVIQVGQETVMYCRNKTGADILDGQVVKIVGAQGDTPNIELAIASNVEEAHRTIGVATQTISANSGKGFITLVGKVRGLDLRTQDGFTEGGLVYLSDTTPGALTPIKPAIEVEIGHVLRLGSNNGTLGVFINNEASVYELEQTLNAAIATNTADIAINTAKVGITPTQASDITTNNAKVGITTAQAADIVTNNAKVGITTAQASDITTNNAKVGITPAQASEINTALQPADPTLDSVTDNGATTTNNITVGSKFATGNNVATGGAAIAIGGAGNTASGSNSDIIGSDNSTASGLGSTIVGGSNISNGANWSAALGGLNQSVAAGANRSAIIAGFNHNMNHADSVILGGSNITTDASNTVFVPSLNVGAGFKMPTGAADGYVLTSDVSGVGAWQANEKVGNDTTGEAAGSDSVLNMVSLTQAEYDTALANFPATIKATTLYIIKP